MISVITPTRARPVAFAHLETWLAAQTVDEPVQHIVVCDGGIEGYSFTQGQLVIHRPPAGDSVHSLCANILAAIPYVAGEKIVILEDDDWVAPTYLEEMAALLDEVALAGFRPGRSYHVRTRRWGVGLNHRHASLAQTGLRRDVLQTLAKCCQSPNASIDMRLWRTWRGSKRLVERPVHLALKGLPGERGITQTHDEGWGQPDPDLLKFREWAVPEIYLQYGRDAAGPPDVNVGRRLVYVLPNIGICGGVRLVIDHLNHLADRGHAVALVTLGGPRAPADWMPIRFPIVPQSDLRWRDADVFVATHWSTARLVLDVASSRPNRDAFYLVQMDESQFAPLGSERSRAAKATYDLPLDTLTISRWLAEFLERDHGHYGVPIIPSGIDPAIFYPDPTIPRTPGKFRVLIEGPESPGNPAKNIRDAHAVVAELRRREVPVECWGFAARRTPYQYDRFWERPTFETMRGIYSSASVLLKTNFRDGRPGAPPEAMACGCPVVIADCLGTDDCEDGRALICPYGDVSALADACQLLWEHPEAAREMAAKARLWVATELSWDAIIPRLEEVYGLTPAPAFLPSPV